MIYTLTMNPAIDYFMRVEEALMDTEVNRAEDVMLKAAGKGINVSVVLNELEIDSVAIALLGGFTGDFIKKQIMDHKHIQLLEVAVDGENRINVKIHQQEKTICVNAAGPSANKDVEAKILSLLDSIEKSDYVLVCGSMMKGLTDDFLFRLSEKVHEKEARLVLDMESLSYEKLIQYRPYLIKPNLYEFKLLMKKEEMNEQELNTCLDQIHQDGVENILVSLGSEGAILKTSEHIYRMTQEKVNALNKVGCGDALLATFIGKLSQGYSVDEALRYGGAAGCATVSSFEYLSKKRLMKYLNKVNVCIK